MKRLLSVLTVVGVMCTSGYAMAQSLTIAFGTEPTTLDPLVAVDGNERKVGGNIFDTVLSRTAEGEIIPNLAVALPRQVDDLHWEVEIRQGVKFHNGETLDANSVAFSINHMLDPKFDSRQLIYFSTLESAEALSDTLVRVKTKVPDPSMAARLAYLSVVPPKAALEAGFATAPVGSGPYKFEAWDRGNQIRITRNDAYWGDKPDFEGATFRFVQESGVRVAGLQAGEFDLVSDIPPESAASVPVAKSAPADVMIISLNGLLGPTADKRVRQALNYAIDRKAFIDDLFLGQALPMSSQLLAPNWFGHNADLGEWPFDPDKARQLIEEAGVAGQSIDLIGTEGRWIKDREILESVAAYWTAAGLTTNVRILAWPDYLSTQKNRRTDASARLVGHTNLLFDADRSVTSYYQPGGTSNAFDGEELDRLAKAARSEMDPAKRLDLYKQLMQIGSDEAMFGYLFQVTSIYGSNQRVDYTPRADGLILLKHAKLVQ